MVGDWIWFVGALYLCICGTSGRVLGVPLLCSGNFTKVHSGNHKGGGGDVLRVWKPIHEDYTGDLSVCLCIQ